MTKKRDPWIENRRHVKNYPHHKSVRIPRSVLKALPRVCVNCGENDEDKLVVDHINRDSLDNSKENLRVLCYKCHRKLTPLDSPYVSFLDYDAKTKS